MVKASDLCVTIILLANESESNVELLRVDNVTCINRIVKSRIRWLSLHLTKFPFPLHTSIVALTHNVKYILCLMIESFNWKLFL